MKYNWYGFNHKAVDEKFSGGVTYVTDMCIYDEYNPVAVYHVASPDRTKGHKDYILLTKTHVRGMDANEMELYKMQDALQCTHCKDVIYSVMRHDMRFCTCGKVAIDGGRDYTKTTFEDLKYVVIGQINHLTGEFIKKEEV